MKQTTIFFLLALTALLGVSCNKSSTKSSNTSTTNSAYCAQYPYATGCTTNNPYCTQNPTAYGCPGNPGTTTGSTTGGSASCAPPVQGQQTSCANYCAYFPGTSGCLSNGTNCNHTPNAAGCPGASTTNPSNYGALYRNGPPAGNSSTCPAAQAPAGNPNAYNTRKGTVTVSGKVNVYNPETGPSTYYNTSSLLTSVNSASTFFSTDALVQIRFKIRPQPDSSNNTGACYDRNTGISQATYGYTKVQFVVHAKDPSAGPNAWEYVGAISGNVNDCTTPLDLSPYKAQYPNGIVIKISSFLTNNWCSYSQAQINNNDYFNCNAFQPTRTSDCWSLDFEVSADTTKVFP